jgi:transcriptional regulator GlxA family with amidase domain
MKVAVFAVPGVQMLDLAGPMDVFAEANRLLGNADAYQVEIVGLTLDTVVADNGTRFLPDVSLRTAKGPYDTLLVAGSPTISKYETNCELLDWITMQSRSARRLGSICTAAFVLAHAGLLNGRKATTHWGSAERLRRMFPKVEVEPNRIYIKDGAIYTSAGVSAAMDLTLALIEEDHGRSIALRIAKELILFLKRPGGQSQFSMHLAAQVSDAGPLQGINEWILANLTKDLSVETLSNHLGISTRSFARLFKRETRVTPRDYVEAARVEAARRILEDSETPIKIVASLCGFADQAGLRRAFLRRINITPAEYRQNLRPAE